MPEMLDLVLRIEYLDCSLVADGLGGGREIIYKGPDSPTAASDRGLGKALALFIFVEGFDITRLLNWARLCTK